MIKEDFKDLMFKIWRKYHITDKKYLKSEIPYIKPYKSKSMKIKALNLGLIENILMNNQDYIWYFPNFR